LAEVDRVFAIGGAGAIGALAYGTNSVPHVDRIVGPGNAYVAEAKLQVSGVVAIDSPAGPSELLVVADDSVDADVIAREVLAQAEHDPQASVVVVALGDTVARNLSEALGALLPQEARREIIETSLATRGAILTAQTVDEAAAFNNAFAPEHLLLALRESETVLPRFKNTGTIFVGETSSVAFGDYMSGANHVLPTGGLARSYSGLSTLDFVRWTTYQCIDRAAAGALADDVGCFAQAEGLPAHAATARQWSEGVRKNDGARQSLGDLGRADYRSIPLYAPNRDPVEIDLSDNTNLWGVPPTAARVIHDAATSVVTRYPALYVNDLKCAIANYLGVTPDMIVTGCGSDDVLDSAIRAFGRENDVIAHPVPSFAMIPIFAKLNGLAPVAVPLTEAFDIDPEACLATRAKITYLCSPNNPTGTVLPPSTVERIVERTSGLVMIDEAYAEFADTNFLDLMRNTPNVLITRTFSKAFGLAGLRVGYAVGDPAVVAEVEKSRGPYKVNAIAERAAVAAMRDDREWVRVRVQEAIVNRNRLQESLVALGLSPLPSQANFVLVPVDDAVRIDRELRQRNVAVRPFVGLPGIGDALRISIGPWEMVERCLDALREIGV
jgi:histidinol-phosphate aminotransferase